MKNKLIHAEINSQVQLNNKKSPSGSMNFDIFVIFHSSNLHQQMGTSNNRKSTYLLLRSLNLAVGFSLEESSYLGISTGPRFRNFGCRPMLIGQRFQFISTSFPGLCRQHRAEEHPLAPGSNVPGTITTNTQYVRPSSGC